MHELGGAVVVITGASRGIGRATAHAFAAIGCHVVLAARSEDDLIRLAAEIKQTYGVETLAVPTDMTSTTQIEHLMQTTVTQMGGIDILINNAGLGAYNPVEAISDDDMEYLFAVNVFGPVKAMRAVIPYMRARGGGHIVNVGSIVSYLALPQYRLTGVSATYCATKFALRAFTTSARTELHADNIRVSLAIVGATDTDFFVIPGRQEAENAHETPPQFARPPLMRHILVPPQKVATRIVRAITEGRREFYISWWDYILVRWAEWAPDTLILLARALFPIFGRPPQSKSLSRPFWSGLQIREWLPVMVGWLLGRWLWHRLFRQRQSIAKS